MYAQIAVRRLQQLFELVERQRIVHRERADDTRPDTFVNQAIQIGQSLINGLRLGRSLAESRAKSICRRPFPPYVPSPF